MNKIEIIDEPDCTLVKVNGVEIEHVVGYSIERTTDSPIAQVSFTLLCDDLKMEHKSNNPINE